MEVDGVLLEQVGAHDQAHVGEGQKQLFFLIDSDQRRRDVAIHHADLHNLTRINVPVDGATVVRIRYLADRAIEIETCTCCRRIARNEGARDRGVEHAREFRPRFTRRDISKAR